MGVELDSGGTEIFAVSHLVYFNVSDLMMEIKFDIMTRSIGFL